MIRFNHSEPFKVIAVDDRISSINTQWSMEDICKHGQRIEILAEFPLSLADLLPEGCTRFEFRDMNGTLHYARLMDPKREWPWHVSVLMDDRGDFAKLEGIAEVFSADLDTVVPLTVDPDWIEVQR